MTERRRIIPRDEVMPTMRHARALTSRDRCRARIELDGEVYRCGRAHVDGIHDAFEEHSDGGSVRW